MPHKAPIQLADIKNVTPYVLKKITDHIYQLINRIDTGKTQEIIRVVPYYIDTPQISSDYEIGLINITAGLKTINLKSIRPNDQYSVDAKLIYSDQGRVMMEILGLPVSQTISGFTYQIDFDGLLDYKIFQRS